MRESYPLGQRSNHRGSIWGLRLHNALCSSPLWKDVVDPLLWKEVVDRERAERWASARTPGAVLGEPRDWFQDLTAAYIPQSPAHSR